VNEPTVTARLHRLAEDLAPDTDPLEQVAGARSRYRRQRRTRVGLTALAAATAAVVIGVPATIGSTSSAPDRGDVAGPRPSAATDAPGAAADARQDAAAAEGARQDAAEAEAARQATVVSEALGRLPERLALSAPADPACPDLTAELSAALGQQLEASGPDLAGGCGWGGPGFGLSLSHLPGVGEEEMVLEANAAQATDGCHVQAMPTSAHLAALVVCDDEARTSSTLYLPDADGTGVWSLRALVVFGPDGATALLALAEAADARW